MLGTILYVGLLTINAIAILNEERFLARIGWASIPPQAANQGYNQAYAQPYDQAGDQSVKSRLVYLISAVRTLLRVPLIIVNIIVIVYELLLG